MKKSPSFVKILAVVFIFVSSLSQFTSNTVNARALVSANNHPFHAYDGHVVPSFCHKSSVASCTDDFMKDPKAFKLAITIYNYSIGKVYLNGYDNSLGLCGGDSESTMLNTTISSNTKHHVNVAVMFADINTCAPNFFSFKMSADGHVDGVLEFFYLAQSQGPGCNINLPMIIGLTGGAAQYGDKFVVSKYHQEESEWEIFLFDDNINMKR